MVDTNMKTLFDFLNQELSNIHAPKCIIKFSRLYNKFLHSYDAYDAGFIN